MSESEIDLSEESEDGDFSVSEDEYVPNNNESSDESDDDEGVSESPTKQPVASTSSVPRNRFKKPNLKSLKSPVKLSTELVEVFERSKFEKKKGISSNGKSVSSNGKPVESISDSDSDSGDDNLVDPNKLDLNSDFFNISKKSNTPPPPHFDCNVGIVENGSLSSDSEDDFSEVPDKNNFDKLEEFSKNLEVAKEHLKNYKAKVVEEDQANDVDVSKLLALGESEQSKPIKKNVTKTRKRNDSNSDWEEVESTSIEKSNDSNLQITVELPTALRIKTRKEVDLDACIKRKFNKIRKDHQVCLHKTNLLCWIAHGNFLNPILNDATLMSQCLSLMPSAMSYPTEKTNLKYFQQITTWYKGLISVKDQSQYPVIKKRPALSTSLGLQIKSKIAICKRDYILIFVILLRSLGIQCRLVMNLVNNPLRPNSSDLCRVSTKTVQKTTTKATEKSVVPIKPKEPAKTEPPATKKPLKSVPKKLTSNEVAAPSPRRLRNHRNIPQLDGNDDLPNLAKLKKGPGFKLKLGSYKADSSFIVKLTGEESFVESPVRKTGKVAKTPNSPFAKQSGNKPTSTSTSKDLPNLAKLKKDPKVVNISKEESPAKKKKAQTSSKDVKQSTELKPVKLHNLRAKPSTSKPSSSDPKSSKVAQKRRSRSLMDDDIKPSTSKESGKPLAKKRIKSSVDEKSIKITKAKVVAPKRRSRSLSDDDFQPRTKKTAHHSKIDSVKKIDSRVLSTDDDERDDNVVVSNKKKSDYWIEVYCEEDERWITIDAIKGKVDCVDDIRKSATAPIAYVIAWHNDNTIKDISPRYCPQWNTTTRLLRVGKEWFDSAFKQFMCKKTRRDIKEDKELNKMHLNAPLPTSIKEFKDHPLYALERDLLKFQAIYPPNALTLGFIRKEPVYARECVHTLHSREIWLKSARTVKMGEVPYKIVKARPKWDRHTNTCTTDIPLEIFGFWQTQEYEPPTAENGVVPRNAYGNVELFKACMLPKKTVHLQFAGLPRVCKRLKVDCAPAVVGFDYHSGSCHPTYDGFVICEEFQEKVTEAWLLDQEESERREKEKYEKRVYDNWKKLIKGLLIRRKLQRKYNFNLDGKNGGEEEGDEENVKIVGRKKGG